MPNLLIGLTLDFIIGVAVGVISALLTLAFTACGIATFLQNI